MTTFIRHNGVYKEPDVIHIKHNGVWKEVSGKQYIPGMPMEGGFFGGFYALGGILYALIVADKSAEQSLQLRTTNSGPSPSSQIDGWTNTNEMNNENHPAAQYTRLYDGGGFDDWYLGSTNEIQKICSNLLRTSDLIGLIAPDFATGGVQVLPSYLWTSSGASPTTVYRVNTSSGERTATNKTNNNPVRPIRKVPINL